MWKGFGEGHLKLCRSGGIGCASGGYRGGGGGSGATAGTNFKALGL